MKAIQDEFKKLIREMDEIEISIDKHEEMFGVSDESQAARKKLEYNRDRLNQEIKMQKVFDRMDARIMS